MEGIRGTKLVGSTFCSKTQNGGVHFLTLKTTRSWVFVISVNEQREGQLKGKFTQENETILHDICMQI